MLIIDSSLRKTGRKLNIPQASSEFFAPINYGTKNRFFGMLIVLLMINRKDNGSGALPL